MDEQVKALILLERRKHGYSIRRVLRSMRRRYFLSIMVCVGLSYMAMSSQLYWFLGFVVGAYFAMFLRDFGWLSAAKKEWAFTERITDWKKVEAIANGDDDPRADRQTSSESTHAGAASEKP